ncbi:MAG: 4Fe-4S ferredoxin, partial [Vicinamibacteria bacterium]|nr:4Fe-4S ferredoxin [Vicinamibacteria bacterium]
MSTPETQTTPVERQQMDVDIACVGFGPAMGGFLTTLSRQLVREDGTPAIESRVTPGLPLQILCYERADDIGFGVSGVCTRARAIGASFKPEELQQVPMATPVKHEKVLYLLDPARASRRSALLKIGDRLIRAFKWMLPFEREAMALPYIPPFLQKEPGYIFSIGQFTQWVGQQIMGTGLVQIWPGTPAAEPLIEGQRVRGVRLADQGVDKQGRPEGGFMPGMDIHADLTVVGDGPVGAIGQRIDRHFGMPDGHHLREWAVGMKFVVDLREDSGLKEGTVLHTFGYPEPEIFGFLYVHPGNVASLGVFIPAWFDSPVRTAYRYLQHWMLHPYLWQYLQGGRLRSWGAKTLGESGRRGEPHLAGDGYARIGEGSGSTNVLTGSGVDEAWETGALLAEGVIELARAGQPFTKDNLQAAYVKRRRASSIDKESRIAEKARDGFQHGFV